MLTKFKKEVHKKISNEFGLFCSIRNENRPLNFYYIYSVSLFSLNISIISLLVRKKTTLIREVITIVTILLLINPRTSNTSINNNLKIGFVSIKAPTVKFRAGNDIELGIYLKIQRNYRLMLFYNKVSFSSFIPEEVTVLSSLIVTV